MAVQRDLVMQRKDSSDWVAVQWSILDECCALKDQHILACHIAWTGPFNRVSSSHRSHHFREDSILEAIMPIGSDLS